MKSRGSWKYWSSKEGKFKLRVYSCSKVCSKHGITKVMGILIFQVREVIQHQCFFITYGYILIKIVFLQ